LGGTKEITMKGKHVILRSLAGGSRDIFLGPAAQPRGVGEPQAVKVEVEELDLRGVSALARHDDVLAVAPSMPMRLIAPVGAPAQPSAAATAWGVKAVGADTSALTGDGIVVAVLDTGIDPTHAAFAGVTLTQKDFTGEGNGDQHGHGTHCAGTIFGRDVNNTRIGVARGVKTALIGKVLGNQGGSSESIVTAIQWAMDNGANVISMSLGMDFPGFQQQLQQGGVPQELATSLALEGYRANVLLFERLAAVVKSLGSFVQSTIIVAAAGNESRRNVNPDFEIAVSPPAVSDGIVSVAALGQSGNVFVVAPFSNTGANVSGPGVAVTSAKLGGGLIDMNGTSMATPHVAGVAALWAQKLKATGALTGFQLMTRLVGTAVQDGLQAGFDPADVGAGMVRAPQN
jgi:subtilisin family serine protease